MTAQSPAFETGCPRSRSCLCHVYGPWVPHLQGGGANTPRQSQEPQAGTEGVHVAEADPRHLTPYSRTCRSRHQSRSCHSYNVCRTNKVPECGVALVNSLKTHDASDFPNTITTLQTVSPQRSRQPGTPQAPSHPPPLARGALSEKYDLSLVLNRSCSEAEGPHTQPTPG